MSFDDFVEMEVENESVSIPLEQGNVFRQNKYVQAGAFTVQVSIPLEQGNVFRPVTDKNKIKEGRSQSLWNRAMSFD